MNILAESNVHDGSRRDRHVVCLLMERALPARASVSVAIALALGVAILWPWKRADGGDAAELQP